MSSRLTRLIAISLLLLLVSVLYWKFHYKNTLRPDSISNHTAFSIPQISEHEHDTVSEGFTAAHTPTLASITLSEAAPTDPTAPHSASTNATSPQTPHPSAITNRIADARILGERIEPSTNGIFTRIRLVEIDDQPYPLRVVDTLVQTQGEPVLIAQHVMAAGHLIVGLNSPQDASKLIDAVQSMPDYTVRETSTPYLIMIDLPEATLDAVPDALANLATLAHIDLVAEPDSFHFPTASPNDPSLDQLYAHDLMDSRAAWDITTGSRDIIIAILDTGVDLDHPDLQANIWQNPGEIAGNGIDDDGNGFIDDVNGWDFLSNDKNPNDTDGHGTHVAGITGAVGDNEIGIAGVNWQVGILPVRVGDANGLPTSAIIAGLDYIRNLRLNHDIPIYVSNNSYGSDGFNAASLSAIQRQQDAGILFVAASGNSGNNSDSVPIYPGAYTSEIIVNVANSTAVDSLRNSSNYGVNSVDLAAPGTSNYSTFIGGTYDTGSGTSYAAPQVAGAIALAYAKDDLLQWQDVKTSLLATVDKIPVFNNLVKTGGRLNLGTFIEQVSPPQLIAITTPTTATRLSATNSTLIFETTVMQYDLPVTPESPILWSVDPTDGAFITPLDDTRAQINFTQEGAYVVTASLTSAGAERTDTKTIMVGSELPGRVADWRFESTGITVDDSSGNDRNGTLSSGATRTTGVVGNAYTGASGQRATIPDLPSLPVMSFATWVKVDSASIALNLPYAFASQELLVLFDFRGANDGTDRSMKLAASRGGDYSIWNTPQNSIQLGIWYHVAVVHNDDDDSTSPQFFINGVEVNAINTVQSVGAPTRAAGPVYLGNRASADRSLVGQLDETLVFDRLLTANEVAVLASADTRNDAPLIGDIANLKATVAQAWTPVLTVSDVDGPSALSYTWEVLDGPDTATIQDAQSATPAITFPTVGSYTLRLKVSDGNASSIRQWSVNANTQVYQVSMTTADVDALLLAGTSQPLTLSISPTPLVELPISYTIGGTAVAGTDYVALPGMLNVPVGEGSPTIPVALLTRDSGSDRTLIFSISSSAHTLGADASVTLTLKPYTYANWVTYYEVQSDLPPDVWALQDDNNTNGINNLIEFSLGLNPLIADTATLNERLPVVTRNGSDQLVMTYVRPSGIDASRYVVGSSPTPAGQPFIALTDQGNTTSNSDGTETVTATDTAPLADGETRFLFLQVSDQ